MYKTSDKKIIHLPVQIVSLLISLCPEKGVCEVAFRMALITADMKDEPRLGDGDFSFSTPRNFPGLASGLLLLLL